MKFTISELIMFMIAGFAIAVGASIGYAVMDILMMLIM